jgi:hypothetical protein
MLAVVSTTASARREIAEDFEISGTLFHFGEYRYQDHGGPRVFDLATDDPTVRVSGLPSSNQDRYRTVNAARFELLIEAVYTGIPNVTPVVKLRPFWDGMFAWENKSYTNLGRYWESNFTNGYSQDRWDPLVREAYVDINFHPLFIRAGRQLVTWGRSDGVVVLDVVNPNNFRNPLTFEQERFRIPLWMLNFNYDLGGIDWLPGLQKELQVIWNLKYQPSRFPGFNSREEGQHPWTLNVVDFADQVIRTSEVVFEQDTFFDNYAYNKDRDFLDESEVFVRWQGRVGPGLGGPLGDFTYSLHYAHLNYRIPFYKLNERIDAGFAIQIAGPRTETTGGIDFETRHYDLVGVSFDKALVGLPGQLSGTVLRTEAAYAFGNSVYDPDLQNRREDTTTYLIGLDQYLYIGPRWLFETPWFTSFQFWQDWIMDSPNAGAFTKLGSVSCQNQLGCGRKGYVDIGEFDLFSGLRQQQRSVVTLFMFNDFLPGKTLHTELFGLHELENQGTWFRGVVGYSFVTNVSARVGYNALWGVRDSFFGQFKENDHFFTEVKLTF